MYVVRPLLETIFPGGLETFGVKAEFTNRFFPQIALLTSRMFLRSSWQCFSVLPPCSPWGRDTLIQRSHKSHYYAKTRTEVDTKTVLVFFMLRIDTFILTLQFSTVQFNVVQFSAVQSSGQFIVSLQQNFQHIINNIKVISRERFFFIIAKRFLLTIAFLLPLTILVAMETFRIHLSTRSVTTVMQIIESRGSTYFLKMSIWFTFFLGQFGSFAGYKFW